MQLRLHHSVDPIGPELARYGLLVCTGCGLQGALRRVQVGGARFKLELGLRVNRRLAQNICVSSAKSELLVRMSVLSRVSSLYLDHETRG